MYIASLEAVSTREDWTVPVEVTDPDTDDAIDITDAEITLSVRDKKTKVQLLTATVGSGITIDDGPAGMFSWTFTASQMGALCEGVHEVGVVIEVNSVKTQLLIGTVPVLDGIVTG